jgi:diguanylate cyclase (GGDEF)-like protein
MQSIILLFFILLVQITSPAYAVHQGYQIDILSIHSYHQEYPWTASQYNAFKRQLTKKLPEYSLNFSTEYLDTKRIYPSAEYKINFLRYLISKYQNNLPNLIYITDDNALDFIDSEEKHLPWTIPVVFSGINDMDVYKSHSGHLLAGVFEYNIQSSISLARKIAKHATRIIFLGDGGTTDKEIKEEINKNTYEKYDFEISYLSDAYIDSLITKLNAIDADIVILTTVGRIYDHHNNILSLPKIIEAITGSGKIILVMEDTYLFPGVLGGYVTSAHIQGESAANIASKIIKGEFTHNTEPQQQNYNEFILSWPDIKRFKLDLDDNLLANAKIIHKPLPLIEQYPDLLKWLLWLVVTIIVILLALSFRKSRLLKEQYTDAVTGLPNRTKLLHDINNSASPSLTILDINNFKTINNLYGMKVGDELLNSFGQKVHHHIKHELPLYRVDGNRFAILNKDCRSPEKFESYIKNLLKNIQNNIYYLDKLEINLTLTAGISRNTHEFLVPWAEQALHYAKKQNKDYFVIDKYRENNERYKNNLLLAQKINSALSDDRIVPYFQVITHNKTGRKDKFEALARLIDINDKIITPAFFLDVAKTTRQYAKLTEIMIEKTLKSIQNKPITVSINFTVDDIRNDKTIALFKQKLNEYQVANRVIVELTESEDIESYSEVSKFIADIKKLGCRVAIDDFGTGYSNFTHLIHLNVDYLKIDGSIIKNIISDKNAEIVAKTLVEFAAQLDIETVAEFVDSQEILDKVTEIGIDYSQGYFLGRPESKPPD